MISRIVTKPQRQRPALKHPDWAYPVDQEDLDQQQERLRKAAEAGAAALKTSAPVQQTAAPTTMPAKPLTPLAVLWPDPIPSKREPRPAQAAAQAAAVAPKPRAPKALSVRFALHKPDAKRVSLCGEFNGWAPGATPMRRHDDGHWETTVPLAPGRYQYKFIADEEWITDPAAQNNVPNQHGSLNSVVEVGA